MEAKMKAAVERLRNSKHEPDVYGFDDPETLAGLAKALAAVSGQKEPKLFVCRGLTEAGEPDAYLVVKGDAGIEFVGNISFTCPPRPPEDCTP